ncbi:type II toxin-antitoxin system MqsA family antitoxin [Pseudoduganella sp.]|uniref:type II toxin-antitoxin system MqsA family antitoxin n=1 Tax=Pseudoduganella sp. TaxID=1880898 RepID=UPI0035AF5377
MLCPVCGEATLIHATRDMPFSYKSASTFIPNVEGDFCNSCGELIMSDAETMRVGKAMRQFQQEVDALEGGVGS